MNEEMEKFDLAKAKQGAKVCTRDGCRAKIICFDMRNPRPILAIVTLRSGGLEYPVQYYTDGSVCKRQDLKNKNHEHEIITEVRNEDLMIL